MNRILVVNVNWIGDVIFSSPIFKSLRVEYPDAHIACMAVPRVKDVLESIPDIDEIILYDEKGKHRNPLAKLGLIFQLFRRRFDVAFLLHRSLTRALLVFLAGIPVRVGYDEKGRGQFLTHKVDYLEDPVHRSDHYLNIIESFGVPVLDRSCQLTVSQKTKSEINQLLKTYRIGEQDFLVIINPGGNWDLKRWPIKHYSNLIAELLKWPNTRIVITGAHKDSVLIRGLDSLIYDHVVDLTGQTNLKQLMALMSRANVVVSADSGPLHLANSVGSDVIGIYGPTHPEITAPRGRGRAFVLHPDVGCNRQACYFLTCNDNTCMQATTVHDVKEIIKQIRNT